jgi:hypothetical protein
MSGNSTLDPDNYPGGRRASDIPPGHDTRSLGPSDSSDSGSDMAGPGLIDDDALPLDRGTNEDQEAGRSDVANAGASVGDDDMEDNSDRFGTGERRAAGKEPSAREASDITADRIIGADEAGLGHGLDQAEEAQLGVRDDERDEYDRIGGDLEADEGAGRRSSNPDTRTGGDVEGGGGLRDATRSSESDVEGSGGGRSRGGDVESSGAGSDVERGV